MILSKVIFLYRKVSSSWEKWFFFLSGRGLAVERLNTKINKNKLELILKCHKTWVIEKAYCRFQNFF